MLKTFTMLKYILLLVLIFTIAESMLIAWAARYFEKSDKEEARKHGNTGRN